MKKLVVGLFIALAAVTSQAEYLWWTVSGNESGYADNIGAYLTQLQNDKVITDFTDVYAKIVVVDKTSGEVVEGMGYTQGFTSEWGTGPQAMMIDMKDIVGTGTASSYSYYVEICSTVEGYESIGKNTQAQTYTEMLQNHNITTEMQPAQMATWHGGSGSYKAAPEPTSAMLMLLGVAGLALKRKQKKA